VQDLTGLHDQTNLTSIFVHIGANLLHGWPPTCAGHVWALEAMVFEAVPRHQGRTRSLQSFKDAVAANTHLAKSGMRPMLPRPDGCP
jgi:hypothetical protein